MASSSCNNHLKKVKRDITVNDEENGSQHGSRWQPKAKQSACATLKTKSRMIHWSDGSDSEAREEAVGKEAPLSSRGRPLSQVIIQCQQKRVSNEVVDISEVDDMVANQLVNLDRTKNKIDVALEAHNSK